MKFVLRYKKFMDRGRIDINPLELSTLNPVHEGVHVSTDPRPFMDVSRRIAPNDTPGSRKLFLTLCRHSWTWTLTWTLTACANMDYKSAIGPYRPVGSNIYKKCVTVEGQTHQKCTTKRPKRADAQPPDPGALPQHLDNAKGNGSGDLNKIADPNPGPSSKNQATALLERCMREQITLYSDICAEGDIPTDPVDAHFSGVKCGIESALECYKFETEKRGCK